MHDKLVINDIAGTQVNLHGIRKNIKGRDYMDLGDIDKTSPAIIKQNKVTNIPDYKLKSDDVDSPNRNKFKS